MLWQPPASINYLTMKPQMLESIESTQNYPPLFKSSCTSNERPPSFYSVPRKLVLLRRKISIKMISYLDLADENEISSQLGWSSWKHGLYPMFMIRMESCIYRVCHVHPSVHNTINIPHACACDITWCISDLPSITESTMSRRPAGSLWLFWLNQNLMSGSYR